MGHRPSNRQAFRPGRHLGPLGERQPSNPALLSYSIVANDTGELLAPLRDRAAALCEIREAYNLVFEKMFSRPVRAQTWNSRHREAIIEPEDIHDYDVRPGGVAAIKDHGVDFPMARTKVRLCDHPGPRHRAVPYSRLSWSVSLRMLEISGLQAGRFLRVTMVCLPLEDRSRTYFRRTLR